MARVRARAIKLSPDETPPESPIESVGETSEQSDNEAATEQLLSETQAAQTPRALPNPPPNSAIKGANLLNAARVGERPPHAHVSFSSPPTESMRTFNTLSSPSRMMDPKPPAGKLKRPSFIAEDLSKRTHAARDIYGIPSPEKKSFGSPYKLPEQVNHKPLKIVKKDKGTRVQKGPEKQPSPAGTVPEASVSDGKKRQEQPRRKRKAGTLPAEVERSSKSRKRASPTSENGGVATRQTRATTRKTHPMVVIRQRPHSKHQEQLPTSSHDPDAEGDIAADSPEDSREDDISSTEQATAAHQDNAPKGLPERPVKRTRQQKGDEATLRPTRSTRLKATKDQSSVPPRDHNNHSKARSKVPKPAPLDSVGNGANDQIGVESRRRPRKGPVTLELVSTIQQGDDEDEDEDEDEDDEAEEVPVVSTEDVSDAYASQDEASEMSSEDEKHSRSHTGSELDRIMEFLDTGARDGDCQTAEGKNLKRYCRRATDLLGDQDVAPEHVLRALDKIRKKSREISAIDDEQLRKDLKADLYGYGFHTFGLLTVSLFDWTAQTYSKPEESIPALQMICGVIDGVVTLKNTVASWKMKLPQRFKGDRLIKDVDETLVVPLRKLSTSLRGKLRYLEELEQQKRSREQRLAEHQRLEAEKETRENFRALEALRKKRWINLHVARKAVEPDIRRAWKLNAPSLPPLDLEERDANGEPFQRLEVFSKRSTPPVPPCSPLKGPEWPEEAMVALISGLEAYAGPFVFERIFKKYCKPGGSLRNYSVLDLASKAADFKARMIRDFGKHNAIWVKRVPSSWEEVPE